MIRKVLIAESDTISFSIPKSYIGKEMEVIVFEMNEGVNNNKLKEKTSFTILHTNSKDYKFNRDDANE